MASGFHCIVLLCLASGLWMEGNCCKTCPSGWTQFGTRCFIFNFEEKQWADAEMSCIAIGGNLASLKSDKEYKSLREMVKTATGSHKTTWVGGHDTAKEGVWQWNDGSKFDFTGWFKGEPNNAGRGEDCMEMNFRGRDYINDAACTAKRSFICAKDL